MPTASSDLSIPQRIARAVLSPSHRQIADVVLEHPLRVAAMPIDELAARAGVSVATANRFARALGFDGYAQFRTALVLGFEAALAPVEKLRAKPEQPASAVEIFAATLANLARNVERTRQGLDSEACARAVSAVLGARRVFILGLGSSAWLAGLLLRKLELYCDSVQSLASVEGPSHAARLLRLVNPGDLVIAIAFPRYLSDTVLLTRRAREAGGDVLALTDSPNSPVAPLASIALFGHADSQSFANCEASALALIEALSSAVAHASGRSVEAAAELAETVLPWLHGNHAGALRPMGEGPSAERGRPAAPPRNSANGIREDP